jgi:hypothetical protein
VNWYQLEISDDDRYALLLSVAQKIGCSHVENLRSGEYIGYLDLLRRLLEVPKLPEGQASAPNAAVGRGDPVAAVATARLPATHMTPEPSTAERVPDVHPEAGELTITPVSVVQDGNAIVVSYQVRTGQKTRMAKTRCWDPKLFSALVASVGQTTTFLTRESKGFLNIVGVKA